MSGSRKFRAYLVAAFLAVCLFGETLRPTDVVVAGALDYGQTSDPIEYTGKPKYTALVFNGASGDRVEISVKGGERKAEVGIADGGLNVLSTAPSHLSFTLPDKGPDPEAYYILFRDSENQAGRFTVELRNLPRKERVNYD